MCCQVPSVYRKQCCLLFCHKSLLTEGHESQVRLVNIQVVMVENNAERAVMVTKTVCFFEMYFTYMSGIIKTPKYHAILCQLLEA